MFSDPVTLLAKITGEEMGASVASLKSETTLIGRYRGRCDSQSISAIGRSRSQSNMRMGSCGGVGRKS